MIKKIIILFLMLIIISSSVFAVVNTITINSPYNYINETEPIQFTISANFPATLHIYSGKDGNGIDFNVSASPGTAIISLTATSASVNSQTGIPTIPVNAFDTITIEDIDNDPSSSLIMDSIEPTNSAVPTIVAGNGNYNSFYSGLITVNNYDSNLTDGQTYTDKHIIYLVPVDDLEDYNTDYTKRYIDANTITTKDINSLATTVVPDGNYYVVIDVNDIAGNYSLSSSVLATKKNVYFDNTDPTISTVSVGTISSNKIYTDENTFDLDVVLSDASGIASGKLTVILPNSLVSTDPDYSSGFSITEEDIITKLGSYSIVSGDIYEVNINAIDNVGNEYDYDFNIIVDLNAPTTPTNITTTIEDVDKNVTITWTASTDTGSALKEYKVYRGTSDFTTTVPSTLICTTTALTCLDDDEDKDLDETYFYGVVAIDNAGNISAANTDSVWTGPDCDIEIDDGNDFTRFSTVNIELTYSNDVNEMAFSCNGTSFSTYEEADEDEDEKIFTITSGNGCTSTSEEKTIYARVRSEDDPTRTTICSAEIYYDNVAPTIPTNITTVTQTNGSVRLSWNASTDQNTNSDITYKIYYSLENNVTTSSSFLETDNTNYNHAPNVDTNVYYKLSAIDEAGNESTLSSTIVGVSRKIGPDLTITITPSNTSDEEIYVGAGIKTIKFVSDEALKSAPQVSVKQASDAFVTVPVIYNAATKSGQIDFNFTKSGLGIAKIVAINNSNETSTTELNFIIDTNVPDFNVDYNANESIFSFVISNYPQDIFRVQYILDNSDELCFKTKEDSNFNCVFDSIAHSDGNHIVSILVYDYALNINRKEVAIVIDNIDEDQVLSSSLKENIDFNIVKFKENLNLFEALRLLDDIDPLIKTDYELLLADISDADKLLLDENFTEAKEKYLLIKSTLETLNNKLPEIEVEKLTSKEMIYDGNTTIPLNLVLDANVISETNELYTSNKIKITRDFEVLKINNQKYFSVTLKIKNESASEKTITTIEEVPKAFSTDIAFLSFTQPFEVLIKDPIFKFTMTIPAESERDFSYRYLKPITDVDLVTKTQKINFANSIVLNGTVPKEKLNVKKPIDKNIFIYLILIIVIFVFILIIVNAIANYTNKKVKVEIKPDSKKEMSDLLGDIKQENVKNEKLEETAKTVEEQKQNADKFQENYDFILSAIKKR